MSDKKELKNEDLKKVSGGSGEKICTDPNRGKGYYNSCTSPDKDQCANCDKCKSKSIGIGDY